MFKFSKNWRKYLEEGELSTSGIATQSGLHPKFWYRRQLDPKVRRKLIKIAEDIALENGISLRKGVYFCLSGPNYETPADLKMINILGGDVVGMSTVPEVIVARQGGTKVMGISVITNKAKLDGSSTTTHEEVIENSAKASAKLEILVSKIINKI